MQHWNDMGLFTAVVESGSFTKAAERTNIPKSTLSRRISALEKQLGLVLLQRTTRKLKLTEVGERYYEQCRRMGEAAQAADELVRETHSEPGGLLRLSTPLSFGTPFLQGIIQEFLLRYPKVKMDLVLDSKKVDLLEESVDIAFRVGQVEESNVIARDLGQADLALVASPSYLSQFGVPRTPEELAKHDVIRHSGAPVMLSDNGVPVDVGMSDRLLINDMMLIREMGLRGLGVAIVPAMIVQPDVKAGLLVPLMLDTPVVTKHFYLVYSAQRKLDITVQAMVNFVMNTVQESRPWQVDMQEWREYAR